MGTYPAASETVLLLNPLVFPLPQVKTAAKATTGKDVVFRTDDLDRSSWYEHKDISAEHTQS